MRYLRIVGPRASFLQKTFPYYPTMEDMRKLAEWLCIKNSRNLHEMLSNNIQQYLC